MAAPAEPDVVVIPAGDALLDDPPRTIHVNVFAIARHPVTNAEYNEFVTATRYERGAWPGGPDDHPAEGISWADAVAYCRWLSVSTARIYRLPDEREWEKTARGAQGRKWPWGNDDDLARVNVREAANRATTAVGAHPLGASPEGVMDLIGNVREWTNTWADGGRVLKGGSYLDGFRECIPSARFRPAEPLSGHGFRVVRGMTGR